ncbi:hypothetical protein BT69DRAFT_411771 [Atractiella rhizophila]|nr:hypothetical protein BT69DRAFT_411771 [Atractiella rhizophila]
MLEAYLGLGQHEATWFINFLLLRPILSQGGTALFLLPLPRLPGGPDPDPPSSSHLIENAEFGVKVLILIEIT